MRHQKIPPWKSAALLDIYVTMLDFLLAYIPLRDKKLFLNAGLFTNESMQKLPNLSYTPKVLKATVTAPHFRESCFSTSL
jgi:hypothetical protein